MNFSVFASLTRYDGGSGRSLFRGAVPLRPGAVREKADLKRLRVLVRGAEPEGFCTELLEDRHADGSYGSAYVEFYGTCDVKESVPCLVVMTDTTQRIMPDKPSVEDPVELAPRSWQAAPTLFALTDRHYLRDAQVSPLFVVPFDDPRLPLSVRTFLSDTFDEWNAVTVPGTAQYDEQFPIIERYLTTGDPKWLAEAIMRNQSDDSARSTIGWSYYVANGSTDWGKALNPRNYAKPVGGGPDGVPSEPWDTSLANYCIYKLTGWTYARIHVLRNAAQWFNDWRETQLTTYDYPRQIFRWKFQQAVLAEKLGARDMLKLPSGRVLFSDPNTWGTAKRTMRERVQRCVTRMKSVAESLVNPPKWFPRLWGVSIKAVDGSLKDGNAPVFQFTTAASLFMAYHAGIDTRPEILEQLDAMAVFIRSQVRDAGVAKNGYRIMAVKYNIQDPALVAENGAENGYYTSVVAWLFAWEYYRTGNIEARDLYDHVMDSRHLMYTLAGPVSKQRKLFGELFVFAQFGAALRAMRESLPEPEVPSPSPEYTVRGTARVDDAGNLVLTLAVNQGDWPTLVLPLMQVPTTTT